MPFRSLEWTLTEPSYNLCMDFFPIPLLFYVHTLDRELWKPDWNSSSQHKHIGSVNRVSIQASFQYTLPCPVKPSLYFLQRNFHNNLLQNNQCLCLQSFLKWTTWCKSLRGFKLLKELFVALSICYSSWPADLCVIWINREVLVEWTSGVLLFLTPHALNYSPRRGLTLRLHAIHEGCCYRWFYMEGIQKWQKWVAVVSDYKYRMEHCDLVWPPV